MAIDRQPIKFPPLSQLEKCVNTDFPELPKEAKFRYNPRKDVVYMSVDSFLELKKREILTTIIEDLARIFAGTRTSKQIFSKKVTDLTSKTIFERTQDLKKILPKDTDLLVSETPTIIARIEESFKRCSAPLIPVPVPPVER